MDILPIIETRRAKRRNGAAYQHRRRRSLTGGHAAITHGRRMEYHCSHSMLLTHSIARLTATSWSDRASLPRKRARSVHGQKARKCHRTSKESNSRRTGQHGLVGTYRAPPVEYFGYVSTPYMLYRFEMIQYRHPSPVLKISDFGRIHVD